MKFDSLPALLNAISVAPRDRDRCDEILRSIAFDINEIRPFCHFSENFYTRNLIARTDDYEILTLCWEPGQISPVHDHAGSDGWVCCVDGAIEEVQYRCTIDASGHATLARGAAATLAPGGVGYINDDIAWHTVGNSGDGRAVSLHCYSPPIDACQYVDAAGRVQKKEMSYFTVDGAPTA